MNIGNCTYLRLTFFAGTSNQLRFTQANHKCQSKVSYCFEKRLLLNEEETNKTELVQRGWRLDFRYPSRKTLEKNTRIPQKGAMSLPRRTFAYCEGQYID